MVGKSLTCEAGSATHDSNEGKGGERLTRSGEEYIASLADGRTVIVDGERVEDVSKHPAFAQSVASVARMYDVANDPANRQLMTYESPSDARPVNMSWLVPDREKICVPADLRSSTGPNSPLAYSACLLYTSPSPRDRG